jgi:hypothetical protein
MSLCGHPNYYETTVLSNQPEYHLDNSQKVLLPSNLTKFQKIFDEIYSNYELLLKKKDSEFKNYLNNEQTFSFMKQNK